MQLLQNIPEFLYDIFVSKILTWTRHGHGSNLGYTSQQGNAQTQTMINIRSLNETELQFYYSLWFSSTKALNELELNLE